MTDQEIIKAFQDAGALLDGHFVLRSGLHSNKFFQAALLFRFPDIAEKLCRTLAERMKGLGATTVISPAVGGILVGQELARALGIQAIFADKENDQLVLKRGFTIQKGEKIIVAEDVVTKGGRVQQTLTWSVPWAAIRWQSESSPTAASAMSISAFRCTASSD